MTSLTAMKVTILDTVHLNGEVMIGVLRIGVCVTTPHLHSTQEEFETLFEDALVGLSKDGAFEEAHDGHDMWLRCTEAAKQFCNRNQN